MGPREEFAATALRLWRDRSGDAGSVKCWTTTSGAVIAIRGRYALKLQSDDLLPEQREESAREEIDGALRLPRSRRVPIALSWLPPHTTKLRRQRASGEDEPALLMHRLDAETVAMRVQAEPAGATRLAADFGRLLARFQSRSPPIEPGVSASEHERASWHHITQQYEEFGHALSLDQRSRDHVARIHARAAAWLRESEATLDARAARGLRRDGHGDLHIDNLHLFGGRATLLDRMPHRKHRVDDTAADLGRLAFEFHRIAGAASRSALILAYGRSFESPPPSLLDYFVAKSLLIDFSVAAKYRIHHRGEQPRLSALIDQLPAVATTLFGLR